MEQVIEALSELAVPLVKADGGELYLVSVTGEDVHVHLAGTCAGCPGATMTRERLLEPTVHGVAPKARREGDDGLAGPRGREEGRVNRSGRSQPAGRSPRRTKEARAARVLSYDAIVAVLPRYDTAHHLGSRRWAGR